MVTGKVVNGPTRRPVAGGWVVLHHVGMEGKGGPVDSMRTAGDGSYRFTIAKVDTGAMYVASSWYHGIAYFSEPVPANRGEAVSLQPIMVYDTASSGPPIRLQRRLVTVARPDKHDGTRPVLELLALENSTPVTRITNDTVHPTWSGAIPAGVVQFQPGQGDISAEAIFLRGPASDTVAVFGPIPPGEAKQLSYSYIVPATFQEIAIPIDQPTGELDLLLEDTTARVAAPNVQSDGIQSIEQRRFASYRIPSLPPAAGVIVSFPKNRFSAQALIPYVVALLAVALVLGLVLALKKRPVAAEERGS
ncbi:MAG TPA: hypothetical protein VLV45_05590 [Gemmatimonadales bacterium]|nr:hypothetical protein [Gemmatimonadales bacterium]